MKWHTIDDYFILITSEWLKPLTRRGIFSSVNSVYDPLGIVCPYTLPAKRLLQKLCCKEIGWVDSLPDPELEAWTACKKDQAVFHELKVERCVGYDETNQSESPLHHFCDASKHGYGTATYL